MSSVLRPGKVKDSGLLEVQDLTSSFGSFTAGQSKNIALTVPPGCSQITFMCRADAAFGEAYLRHGDTVQLEEPVEWLGGLRPNTVSRRMARLTDHTELRLVAGSSPVTPTEIRAYYWRDDVANQVQLTGSQMTEVDSLPALRTKQVALAHVSFDLGGELVATIAAGATVQDLVSQRVNGFSTLSVIGKGIAGGREQVKVEARWQSTPGFVSGDHSVLEDIGTIPDVSPYSLVWSGQTRSQYVFLRAQNQGEADATVHVHGMLRV